MKTLNQIAKENKVSKQQVYRIYKTEIEPLGKIHRLNNIIHLDEAGENIVKSRLFDKTASESHHEAHQGSEVLHRNEAVENLEKTDFLKKPYQNCIKKLNLKHIKRMKRSKMLKTQSFSKKPHQNRIMMMK